MNESIFLIVCANVLVLALLMLVLLFSRLHWAYRLSLVFLVSGAYWVLYQGWIQAQGWPTNNSLPHKFLLHGAVIEEPAPDNKNTGTIFIWATDLDNHLPAGKPRAYETPYSKKLHSATQEALNQMRNGELQLGTKQEEQKIKTTRSGYEGEVPLLIEFSNLPSQALPEK